MPSYIITSQEGVEKHCIQHVCFADLGSSYSRPASIKLILDQGNECETLHSKVTIEQIISLYEMLFRDLGYTHWKSGIKLERCLEHGSRDMDYCVLLFDETVPVPVAASVMTLFRMSNEGFGNWEFFWSMLDLDIPPRHAVIVSQFLGYWKTPFTGSLKLRYRILGEHGMFRPFWSSPGNLKYYLNWENENVALEMMKGGMKEFPTYVGRTSLLVGGMTEGEGYEDMRKRINGGPIISVVISFRHFLDTVYPNLVEILEGQ